MGARFSLAAMVVLLAPAPSLVAQVDSIPASKLVDTVVVTPTTLSIRVGQSARMGEAVRVIGYDLDGNRIQGFRARLFIEVGKEFADLTRDGFIRGIKAGSAVLVVAPPSPPGAQGEPKGTARVLIRVEP